jgi:iron complex outermembrane receptor protein
MTLGYYARRDLSFLHADFGLRHEKVARKNIDEAVNIKENNTSAAFTLGRYIGDSLDIELSYASVARVPSAVELFMEGPHLATQRYEVGNHNLTEETSNNTDLTFTFYGQIFFSELTLFKNRVDDYVYLLDGTDTVEGLIRSVYSQRDAVLKGYEFELGRSYQLANGDLTISYGRDTISGKFNDGSYIPRIVPARDIYEVSYKQDNLTFVATLKNVHKQNDINELETATDGFSMLDISILKSLQLSEKSILTVSVFGKNLLDEIARNHSSFVKNEIPLPGRNLGIRFNMTF